MTLFGVAIVAIALLAYLYVRRSRQRVETPRKLKLPPIKLSRKNTRYHAVMIVCADQACEAARSRAGIKYLSGEAPALPLADCCLNGGINTVVTCMCRYEHYEDRREDDDRRSLFGNRNGPVGKLDQRSGSRRGADTPPKNSAN